MPGCRVTTIWCLHILRASAHFLFVAHQSENEDMGGSYSLLFPSEVTAMSSNSMHRPEYLENNSFDFKISHTDRTWEKELLMTNWNGTATHFWGDTIRDSESMFGVISVLLGISGQ